MTFEWYKSDFPSLFVKKWKGKSLADSIYGDVECIESTQWDEWKENDALESGSRPPMVLFNDSNRLFIRTTLRKPYELEEEDKNRSLFPHQTFRLLKSGDIGELLSFLNKWGPLTWSGAELGFGTWDWIDAHDFWVRQLRFSVLTDLFFSSSADALRRAWLNLFRVLPELDSIDPPINSEPADPREGVYEFDLPWVRGHKPAREWISRSPEKALREEAMWLLARAITSSNSGGIWRWIPVRGSGESFRFELTQTSTDLWGYIWYRFASDTTRALPPRICSHCQLLFYPPRKNRYYCTKKEQEKAAKNKWWNENKEEELKHRKMMRKNAKK